MTPDERGGFFPPTENTVTRSFLVAVHLLALGHPVLGIRSRDGNATNVYISFPPAARKDLETFYRKRNVLAGLIDQAIAEQGKS